MHQVLHHLDEGCAGGAITLPSGFFIAERPGENRGMIPVAADHPGKLAQRLGIGSKPGNTSRSFGLCNPYLQWFAGDNRQDIFEELEVFGRLQHFIVKAALLRKANFDAVPHVFDPNRVFQQ